MLDPARVSYAKWVSGSRREQLADFDFCGKLFWGIQEAAVI